MHTRTGASTSYRSRTSRTIAWLTLAALAVATRPALAEAGVQWEYTGTMKISGMQMPMPPVKVCSPAGNEMAPLDKRCQLRELGNAGGTRRYHVSCTAPDPMEGDGEISRQGDTLRSVIHLKTARGDMDLEQIGHKGGACELPK